MATYNFYGYSNTALSYNETTGEFDFIARYDYTTDRIDINITDDDGSLDGDNSNPNVGEDINQVGTISTPDGTVLDSGQIYSQAYALIESPTGDQIYIDRIEIDGVHYGYAVSDTLVPGTSYTIVETYDVDDSLYVDGNYTDTRAAYVTFESTPCFGQGTTLMTDQGALAVDWIRPGDRILTRDHGFQPVLWADRTIVRASTLEAQPKLRPIRIAAHSVDHDIPAQDLLLSAEHRVLLKSPQIELMFGYDEAFAPAKSILNGSEIARILPGHEISYYHILFEHHEVVLAEGLWVESFFPCKMALSALPQQKQSMIHKALGARHKTMKTARPCLRPWEAALLTSNNRARFMQHLQIA